MGGRWSTVNDLDPHVLTADREGLPEGCKGTHGWRNSKEKRKRKEQEHPEEERREMGSRLTIENRCMDLNIRK